MSVRRISLLAAALLVAAPLTMASRSLAQSILKDGDVIAICGDSITEQKMYSVFIEDYLLMCQPKKVKVMQFGWSGERAPQFADRMKDDVLIFKPTIATTCYGMNDGAYRPIDDSIRKAYRDSMEKVIKQFKDAGTRVVVGSPGAVDTESFKRTNITPDQYNENLQALGLEGKALAEAEGQIYTDVNAPMIKAMADGKAKNGKAYHVGGGDGVHPAANGHLVMAYAFLKGMGFDGDVGSFTIDIVANKAEATGGHKVVKTEKGEYTFESTQYPFCFGGNDLKNPNSTAGVLGFVPFNQELNRLTLKVVGPADKYRVTWGKTTKEYTADQLKEGVNLAADFIENPFSEPFNAVERKIREKQQFETRAFKNVLHSLNEMKPQLKNDDAIKAMTEAMSKSHSELSATATSLITPVTHTIKFEHVQ